jgi:hypothetical protein
MRLVVALLAAIGVSGCAWLPERKTLEEAGMWPSRTKTWCAPRAKYSRERERSYIGVRCYFQ